MADTFVYNGIGFTTVFLQSLNAEAIYDAGDQSVQYTRTVLLVTGTIAGASNATAIRQSLLVPRKALQVIVGGTTLFNIVGADDLNGPKPRRCDVSQIIGQNFAMVTFEIEVNVQEEPGTISNVISNNFTVDHQLDEQFYTTRTITGLFRLRQTAAVNNPDALRGLVSFLPPPNFQRVHMGFFVAEDGLSMRYEIVDREVQQVAPPPATHAAGTFSVKSDNYQWYNNIHIELAGHKFSTKVDMFNLAFAIVQSRIDFQNELVLSSEIEEDLYDNAIRVSFTTRIIALSGGATGGAYPSTTELFTEVPGNPNASPNIAETLGPYGSALIAAAKKAFYDPANPPVQQVDTQGIGNYGITSTVTTGTLQPGTPPTNTGSNNLSQAQQDGPYKHYEQGASSVQHNGTMLLPSSKATSGAKVYQMHDPYLKVIQSGQATRSTKPPDVPAPLFANSTTSNSYVASRAVHVHSPQPLPDKTNFDYPATWHYEILVPLTGSDIVLSSNGSAVTLYDVDTNLSFTIPTNDATAAPNPTTITTPNYTPSGQGGN